jgi:adenylate kinase family enzyme
MQRVSIIGGSGPGKSTLAQALSRGLSLTWLELDSVHHQADWTPIDEARFHAAVAEHVGGERWVVRLRTPAEVTRFLEAHGQAH